MQLWQENSKFDGTERMFIEKPGHICAVSVVPSLAYLELWDVNGLTLPFLLNGVLVGAARLTIPIVPASLAYLCQQAGYSGATPVPANSVVCTGFPNDAVGGMLLLDPGAAGNIVVNTAGTANGSAGSGNGIAVGRAGPIALGPRVIVPGGTLTFARFLQ